MSASEVLSVQRSENFVRYVGGTQVEGRVVNGGAFERTKKDVDGVSVVRRRMFSKVTAKDLQQIRNVVSSRLKLGTTAVFVEVNVGMALDVLHEFDTSIAIVADPLATKGAWLANPAHALIKHLPFQGESLGSLTSELAGDLLARKVVAIHPAVIPPKKQSQAKQAKN